MKLAEADSLRDERGQEPILLLDDLLSELDSERRAYLLGRVSRYQQAFITTADTSIIEGRFLSRMARYEVRGGGVTQLRGPSTGLV
jgi:DNA replication and repair protein RecF